MTTSAPTCESRISAPCPFVAALKSAVILAIYTTLTCSQKTAECLTRVKLSLADRKTDRLFGIPAHTGVQPASSNQQWLSIKVLEVAINSAATALSIVW